MHKFFLSPYPKDATHQINWLRLDHLYNMSLWTTNCSGSMFNFGQNSMSFIIAKFHKIQERGFKGIAMTNCFSGIFNIGPIFLDYSIIQGHNT